MHAPMNTPAIEQEEVRVGYLALTDCAPIIVAAALGFDRQYGIRIVPSREPSWAARSTPRSCSMAWSTVSSSA